MNSRVSQELLDKIGVKSEPYILPFALVPADKKLKSDTIKGQVRRSKIIDSLEEAIKKCGLKDGMTISFHHHFRNGDKILPMVMDTITKMGIKNLRIASSSLTGAHECLVEHIEAGVVDRIETSGLRGKLAKAISEGKLPTPAVIRSHGGRARAIVEGDVHIDVAFLGASSSDDMGNANGTRGKSICGSLGYAMVDARYADKTIIITDTLVDYPNYPISIPQTEVDYVVVVDEVGDSSGIMSGATRMTKNPKELLIARKTLEVMLASGLFVDGFSMQTGSGGASLAVTRFIRDELIKRNIKCSFGLGGITKAFVDLLEEGLIEQLFDVQSFDLVACESVGRNPRHMEISGNFYANPMNDSPAVDKLDFVVLSALEIDKDFNVNVISGSDGVIRAASGGHSDTAAASKISIIVAPLTRGRLATVVDSVTTIVTPGSTVDVLVTDMGIAVNPQRKDLIEKFNEYGLQTKTIEELLELAKFVVGTPKPIEFSDKVVAVVEYRDGTVIDVIRKVK